MPHKRKWVILFFLIGSTCQAKNLGVYGPVFDIREKSLLEVITQKLSKLKESGTLEFHQKEIQKRAIKFIERPVSVKNIQKASRSRRWFFNPTFVVEKDIKDHKGTLIAKKGMVYNPLDYASFGIPLLFVDGDDNAQVKWACSQKGKIVLVNGSPLDLEKTHNKPFYFDQGGVLVKKFGIQFIPAKISQEEKTLKIEEILIGNSL